MRYRKLGTTDLSVSVICLGTMTFGEQNSQQDGFDQMDYALERGVNFFDTAELYAVMPKKETYGKTEEILGNWFQEKKNRDKIILASKIASKSDGLEWIREGSENLGFDKKNMNAAIDASLRRLKTDYIDLYQLHWPERKVPKFGQLDYKHDPKDNNWTTIEEVLFNLNELIKAGKVRHVGLSNETPWGMMKYQELSKENGFSGISTIQNPYSLLNRTFEIGMAEVCHREGIQLLAYSPLGFGVLTGKYLNNTSTPRDRLNLFPDYQRYSNPYAVESTKKYLELANKLGVSLTKLALQFVTTRPFMVSNIIGATNITQLEENILSLEINMTNEILKEIEIIHASFPNPSP